MSLVATATTLSVALLVTSVVLAWVADLRRTGGAISARESQIAAERAASGRGSFRGSFYTTREERAEAMRERIRRERRRRERAQQRSAAGRAAEPPPRTDRPVPVSPEDVHRATLELGPGLLTPDDVRAAYRRLVVAYHPDRVAGLGEKLQRLAEEETKSINEAYAFFKARL